MRNWFGDKKNLWENFWGKKQGEEWLLIVVFVVGEGVKMRNEKF